METREMESRYRYPFPPYGAAMDPSFGMIGRKRRMRAFDPFPGCGTTLDGMELKLWRAIVENVATRQPAGTITAVDDDALIVQCGQQALRVLLVQKPGGKRMTTAELLRGTPVAEGMRFQ